MLKKRAYGKEESGIWNLETESGKRNPETDRYMNDSSFGSMIHINKPPPFSLHSLQDG